MRIKNYKITITEKELFITQGRTSKSSNMFILYDAQKSVPKGFT